MSREIKFRAWVDDSMWTVNGLALSDNADVMDLIDHTIGGYQKVSDYDYTKDCVLMQYTGLKDWKDREIYEGDILKDDRGFGVVKWIQEHSAFLVYVKNPAGYHYLECDGQLKNSEVVGNIYKNPELLEDEHE